MNKNGILFLLLSLLVFYGFSQEKKISLKLKNKSEVYESYFNNDGKLFLLTAKISALGGDMKNQELICYDEELNKKFSRKFESISYDKTVEFSNYGDYFLIGDVIIDSEGKVINNKGKSSWSSFVNSQSELNSLFSFFNEYAYTIIGPKNGRKNKKKVYDDGDILIYNLKNSNQKEETFTLQVPNIETNRKTAKWNFLQEFNNGFFLTSTNLIEKNEHESITHFARFNYNGNLIKYTKISLELDNDKYFLYSTHKNGPVYHSTSVYTVYNGPISHSGSYIDPKEETILMYGYYSKTKGGQNRVSNVDGIYAHKFDNEGTLLWKKKYPFSKTKKGYSIKREISYIQSKGKGVLLPHLVKQDAAYLINASNGELEKTSEVLVDFFDKKKKLKEDGFLYFKGAGWGYTFNDKKTNNNNFRFKILAAMLLKPEIKKFLLDRSQNVKKATYKPYFNKNGEIIIMEALNKYREVNIYKF